MVGNVAPVAPQRACYSGVIVRSLRQLLTLAVIASLAAFLLIVGLLLIGVKPHLVFLPGFALRSILATIGIHTHNRVGVIATGAFWWAIVVVACAVALHHRRRRGRLTAARD